MTPYYEHNIDTRDQGTVRYAISGSSNEIMRVSHFIQDETGVNFYGRTMIVAEWNRVPRDLSSVIYTSMFLHLYIHFAAGQYQHLSRHPNH